MTTKRLQKVVELPLEYRIGRDEPEKGIYRNSVVPPKYVDELAVVVRHPSDELSELAGDPDFDLTTQIHIVGSGRALEELGKYFVALARLETEDKEPYGSIDDVPDGSSGTLRILPRRVEHTKGTTGQR